MPSFKPKATKKIICSKKNITTVDNKHQEKMDEFKEIENSLIPSLLEEKKQLKEKIKNEKTLEIKLELKDRLKEVIKIIKVEKKKKKEYLLQNAKHVFDYFEKKKNLSDGKNKKKILHSFFNKNKKIDEKKEDISYIQKYLTNVDDSYFDINNYIVKREICNKCSGELVCVEHEGVQICKKCGTRFEYLVEHEKPSYKEPPKEVCFYAYKRINHFREILAQFQAKETTQIPEEVISNIKAQIKKERITLKHMTNKKAKDILKKLGYNKYYEHIPFIKDKLGIKPPIMSPELEDKLCSLFMDIQRPYAKHCPDDRVNFLNYYYVLYKMCELLGENKFLPFFPMLKDPVKRIEQDEIWKKICNELSWEYVPTI
jgi:ribosomal protein L37AE/L43A